MNRIQYGHNPSVFSIAGHCEKFHEVLAHSLVKYFTKSWTKFFLKKQNEGFEGWEGELYQ
jgi:hypothetical protein